MKQASEHKLNAETQRRRKNAERANPFKIPLRFLCVSASLRLIYAFLIMILGGCAAQRFNEEPTLASINLINREGMSETISNPERLKQYQNVDFLCSQPYQKVLRVYHRSDEGDTHAYVTSYYPNGQIKQYLEVLNGRAYGPYREWYEDGTQKVEACIIGGEADITTLAEKSWLFDGLAQAWDEEGRLSAVIPYEKGQLQGVSLYYHTNGTIWKRTPFERGLAHGTHEVFYENGLLLQTADYCKGMHEGEAIRYWDDESTAAEETYCNDRLITGRYYDRCGDCIAQIDAGKGYRAIFNKDDVAELQEYREGVMEGEVKIFGYQQRLVRKYHIKNGLKHGEEVEYFSKALQNGTPQPKLSVNWYEGKIQGVVKTWYDNNKLESKREMSNNIKNGALTAWFRDGNLMLYEEYDHNKLVRGEYYTKGDKVPVSHILDGKGIATLYDAEGNFVRRVIYHNSVPVD